MLNELSDQIVSFSSQSRRKIASILSESLVEKNELSNLVSKISSFSSPANYAPNIIRPLEPVQKETIFDIARDVDLRTKSQYEVSNSISLLTSSMANIFGGEISKIEKDLNYLEGYVDKYSFISGEDDLYNSSFIENFDNEINSYQNDSIALTLSDRDRSCVFWSTAFLCWSNSRFIEIFFWFINKNNTDNTGSN